jgi:hypothetical protein
MSRSEIRAGFLSRALLVVAAWLPAACASVEERPRTEDDARVLAPLPACLVQLEGRTDVPRTGVTKSLREEQIWTLVYPSFDPKTGVLPEDAKACTGRAPLRDPSLAGGTPAKIDEGAVALGGGSDRLKVAWLRSRTFPDGTVGGALALIRSFEGTAEVYAVGSLRARPKTQLSIERIGHEVVAVAQDDGCTNRKPGTPCEAIVSVYRPRFGSLDRVATIAQERVSYATDSEPGIRGRVEYRLGSSIQYVDGGIRVLEQVVVRDELGREVRKAELERAYTFAPDGSMVVDEDSLWSRVAASKPKPNPAPEQAN